MRLRHRPAACRSRSIDFVWIVTFLPLLSACTSLPTFVDGNEVSVAPGINESWKSADIEPLVGRLEAESREVFVHRAAIAAAAGPLPGSSIADIGAGSGLMVGYFSGMVGPHGRVYAVDINAHLLDLVAERATDAGLTNVETVVCGERSVDLPDNSIDLAFICDTYHHFEYPRATMRSLHRALRPGGQVVIVDFERIPGVTRPFLLDHVRAGRETFTNEIVSFGFELINAHPLPFLEENYMLRFRRRDD